MACSLLRPSCISSSSLLIHLPLPLTLLWHLWWKWSFCLFLILLSIIVKLVACPRNWSAVAGSRWFPVKGRGSKQFENLSLSLSYCKIGEFWILRWNTFLLPESMKLDTAEKSPKIQMNREKEESYLSKKIWRKTPKHLCKLVLICLLHDYYWIQENQGD